MNPAYSLEQAMKLTVKSNRPDLEGLAKMKFNGMVALASLLSVPAFAKSPDCTGPRHPPATLAKTYLKETNILDPRELLADKTVVIRLNSEKIGKDLHRQVYLVRFTRDSGETLQTMVVYDAASTGCNGRKADVYLVSPRLDPCDTVPKTMKCGIEALTPPRN